MIFIQCIGSAADDFLQTKEKMISLFLAPLGFLQMPHWLYCIEVSLNICVFTHTHTQTHTPFSHLVNWGLSMKTSQMDNKVLFLLYAEIRL